MSAYEELEGQLIDSVAERSRTARSPALSRLERWWRVRVGRPAMVVALPLLFLALTVTVALVSRAGANPSGTPVAAQRLSAQRLSARVDAAPCRPCQAVSGRLHAPLGESGLSPAEEVAAASGPGRVHRGYPVVRWTSSWELPPQTQAEAVG